MMSQDLTTRTELPGLLPDKLADDLVGNFKVIEDSGEKMLVRLPTAQERERLQARREQLVRVLRPISMAVEDKRTAARALASLFAGYPSLRNASAEDMLTAYIAHLQDLPLFAIQRACDDVIHRRIKGLDPDWPPASPRIYEVAERYASRVYLEKLPFDHALSIRLALPPPDPARSEKVRAKLQELAEALKTKNRPEETPEHKAAAATIADAGRRYIRSAYEQMGAEPVHASDGTLISPQLLALLKDQNR